MNIRPTQTLTRALNSNGSSPTLLSKHQVAASRLEEHIGEEIKVSAYGMGWDGMGSLVTLKKELVRH